MANILSAKKQIIINKNNRLKNNSYKSKLKTYIKKLNKLLKQAKFYEANLIFNIVQSLLDKLSKKYIIHPNKCKRYKSKIMIKINKLMLSNN